MKNTGITRRIDELGRIVIPKEIRNALSIRDGESIEIYMLDNKIILEKHLIMETLANLSKHIIDIFSTIENDKFIVTDREKVICASHSYEYLLNNKINMEMIKTIDTREPILSNNENKLKFIDTEIDANFYIYPIINNTDCLGLVIFIKADDVINKNDFKICKIISKLISKKINLY